MTAIVEFCLPYATQSLNAFMRQHWRTKRRHAKAVKQDVAMLTVKQRPARPFNVAVVHIERESAGTLDFDNLAGGCKPILDALQACGIIRDDTIDAVRVQYRQRKGKRGQGKTRVKVVRSSKSDPNGTGSPEDQQ